MKTRLKSEAVANRSEMLQLQRDILKKMQQNDMVGITSRKNLNNSISCVEVIWMDEQVSL